MKQLLYLKDEQLKDLIEKLFISYRETFSDSKKILKILKLKTIKQWVSGLNKLNVPCGPINNIKQVFDDPQVNSRKMKIEMTHKKLNRKIKIIGNPIKFSESKIKYLADSNLELLDATGLEIDLTVAGLGKRLSRFAIFVDDGLIKKIFDEEGGGLEKSSAENLLKNL